MQEKGKRWKGLYRAGGLALIVVGILYLLGAVFSIIIGPPPSGTEEYMTALAGHRLISLTNFWLFALTDFLLIPAVLALYSALKGINRPAMLTAAGLMGLFVVLDGAITEATSLSLVTLSQNFATATTDAQRSAYVSAANSALSTLPISTWCSYVISSVALLIIALVMLKGIFTRLTAFAGLTAGLAGIVGGFYIVVPYLAVLLTPSLVAFGIWSLLVGSRLNKLGKQ